MLSKIISEYGKVLICVICAVMVIIPTVVIVINHNLKEMAPEPNAETHADNSFLSNYDAPTVFTDKEEVKIDLNDTDYDLKELFNVKATINNGNTEIDSIYINYDAQINIEKAGNYPVRFFTTYTYTLDDGSKLTRDGEINVRVIVE